MPRSRAPIAVLALAALAACANPSYRDTDVALDPVEAVDLTRYAGRWYEIARFPVWFEDGCVGVTADYALRDDGRVDVVNTCRQGSLDGPVERAEGVARAVDPSNARLKVKFVEWLPFEGDYVVIALDDDYETAVVGTPGGGAGWILARSPQIPQERLDAAAAAVAANGYDTSDLIFPEQVGGGA